MTVAIRSTLKLLIRYFLPFQIIQKIGKVAYKLDIYPILQDWERFSSFGKNYSGAQLLVQWEGSNEEDAIWMHLNKLRQKYLELMGKFSEERGCVMSLDLRTTWAREITCQSMVSSLF